MTRLHHRRRRALPIGGSTVAAALAVLALTLSGSASAHDGHARAVPAPPAVPTSADQIQNIDQVKTAIKGYYGDTVTTAVDPVPNDLDGGDKVLHTFSPTSPYVHEVGGIVHSAEKFLARRTGHHHPAHHPAAKRAVLFDVDDTTLNTYNYEIYSNFVYVPAQNAAFVNSAAFPAVPHVVGLEQYAIAHGYTVFFLTGRPVTQHDGTITNLTKEGYSVTDANLYLKDLSAPWLASCAPTCSTIQYKSLTRQHIESLGYDIVANFGDQYSDLSGGYADKTFKLPNPMYFLP